MEDMEIDAFAQKMLERTQARRDMINKKLPNNTEQRKQRDALLEDKITQNEYSTKSAQEDTLKRKSNDDEAAIFSPKRRSIEAPKDNTQIDKENYDTVDIVNEVSALRGLAALRKKNTDEIAGVFSSNPTSSLKALENEPKPELSNSPHITHARSRLAALASNINQWEDDLTVPKPDEPKFLIPKSPAKQNSTLSTPKSPAKQNAMPLSVPLKSPAKQNPKACEKSVLSPVKEKVAVSETKVEVAVVPKAQPAKQEAQGFTKSASASTLSYKYEKNADSTIRDRMKLFENQKSDSTSPKKAATLPRKLGPISDVFSNSKPETPIQTSKASVTLKVPVTQPQKAVETTPKPLATILKPIATTPQSTPVNVDPANLPLSARRAMFETPVTPSKNTCETPELLSVTQRTALFEKAMNMSPNRENVANKPVFPKINSSSTISAPSMAPPKTIVTTPTQSGILKNDVSVKDESAKKIVHFSPTKSVEAHTAQLQQNLLEKVNKTTTNDIANKMIEERKKELEELKNRWNRSPKKPFNPFGQPKEDEDEDSDTEDESDKSREVSTNDAEESSISNSPIPPPPPPMPIMTARYVEEQTPKSMTPQTSFNTESRLVCEKFDEMLDDVLNEFSSSSDEEQEGSPSRLYPSLSKLKKLENSPNKLNVSPPKSIRYVEEHTQPDPTTPKLRYVEEESVSTDDSYKDDDNMTPMSMPSTSSSVSPNKPYINPISHKEESPVLTHSISLYRRQNQQLSNNSTPVHVVKRNVEINLSPAHQEDNEYFEEVQERIKQLQEDLHRQDVQVKQACQALFLCAAKPEFFGSTEHVEGERLLLITTHKRNACKNSIEQLKTEAALGFNPAGERGTLSISEIRLPLKQEFLQAQLGGQMHESIHYFFCLIRYREKVIATEMLNTKDGITAGTFSFSNHICLQDLRSNFSVLFEVYALQTSARTIPHDRKYNIRKEHSKLKITPKNKKLDSKVKASPALSTPEPRERASNFDVVGMIRLNIENCRRRVLSLEKVPSQSPMEGRVTMKLKLCTEQPIKEKGFLTMFEDVSGFGNWYRRWFVLSGNFLSYWKYPDNEKTQAPMGTIDLRQCITPEVGLINPNVCVRKHTFSLMSVRTKKKDDKDNLVSQSHNAYVTTEHRLSADTKEERILWCTRLNQALDIIRKWDPEALRPLEIKT